jgi:hypothetical protein
MNVWRRLQALAVRKKTEVIQGVADRVRRWGWSHGGKGSQNGSLVAGLECFGIGQVVGSRLQGAGEVAQRGFEVFHAAGWDGMPLIECIEEFGEGHCVRSPYRGFLANMMSYELLRYHISVL